MNARSEFVEPTNCVDGGELEMRWRFHEASAAGDRIRAVAESRTPGFKPTRGSGLGADVDMLGTGDGVVPPDEGDEAHAFT